MTTTYYVPVYYESSKPSLVYGNCQNNFLTMFLGGCGYTEMAQAIVSFALGVILAPFSVSFLEFVVILLLLELLRFIAFEGITSRAWSIPGRFIIFAFGVAGWIVGHSLINQDPFNAQDEPNQQEVLTRQWAKQQRYELAAGLPPF